MWKRSIFTIWISKAVAAVLPVNERLPLTDNVCFGTALSSFFFRNQFLTEPEELFVYNTLHWKDPDKYRYPVEWYEEKLSYQEEHFSQDLQMAYDAGVRFAEKVKAVRGAE